MTEPAQPPTTRGGDDSPLLPNGPGAPSAAATALRWRIAITLAFALGGITVATFGTRLPSIQAALGASKTVIGTALMGVTIGALVGLGAAPWLHRRFGARRGIAGSLTVVAFGLATIGLGAGLGHSLAATTLGLAVIGLGVGSLDVLINVEGSAIEQALAKTLMPQLHASWSAGAILGAALGSVSAAVGLTFTWQFCGEAALLLVATWYVVSGIPEHEEPAPSGTHDESTWLSRALALARGLANVRLLLIGLVMLGAELGEGSANNWLTLAARDEHHHSEAVAAVFFVLFAAGETAARLAGGALVDRIGRVAVVRVTTAAGVVGVLAFILSDQWWLNGLGVLLWAVGVSMGFPLGMSAAAESGPNSAAQVSAVAVVGYAANLAGPPSLGLLADHVGLLGAFWVVVAFLVGAFIVADAVRPSSETT